jgi:hypothetical protein
MKLEVTKALLAGGAELLTKGPDGESPLHLLAPLRMLHSRAHCSIIEGLNLRQNEETDFFLEFKALYQYFVDAGCECEFRDNLGNSPLWPYVSEVDGCGFPQLVVGPAPANVEEMLNTHNVFALNKDGDTLLLTVAARDRGAQEQSSWVDVVSRVDAEGLECTAAKF